MGAKAMPSNRPVRTTIREPRSIAAVLLVLAALIAGCAPAPTPPAPTPPAPTPTASPSLVASPTATPSSVLTPSPTPKPTAANPSPTASPAPSPISLPAFTSAVPPAAGAAWTGIGWHKLKAGDSFAKVRSIVRWRRGFVALGAVVTTGDTWRTPVWMSADGVTWLPLAVDVFGPTTIVLGVGETAHGVVALTLQSGANQCLYSPAEFSCAALAGPLQSWTSPDAVTWTAHPGPSGMASPAVDCDACGVAVPIFRAGSPGLIVVNSAGAAALSRDGIAWKAVPASAFPAHFQISNVEPFGSGFIATGDSERDPLRAMALLSSDGRHWVAYYLPYPSSDRSLGTVASGAVVGSNGVIVGGGYSGAGSPPA
jgi:hypothetical protein